MFSLVAGVRELGFFGGCHKSQGDVRVGTRMTGMTRSNGLPMRDSSVFAAVDGTLNTHGNKVRTPPVLFHRNAAREREREREREIVEWRIECRLRWIRSHPSARIPALCRKDVNAHEEENLRAGRVVKETIRETEVWGHEAFASRLDRRQSIRSTAMREWVRWESAFVISVSATQQTKLTGGTWRKL